MLINLLLIVLVLVSVGVFVMLPPLGALVLLVVIGLWLGLTRRGRQAVVVTGVGLSTLAQRRGSSAVIVVGIAGVVGVLVALLAMAEGYTQTLRQTGGEDTVIIMRGGSASEVSSVLGQEEIVQIQQAAAIARDAKGEPLATAEGVFAVTLPLAGGKGEDDTGSVQIRGISAKTFEVRTQAKIIEGRMPTPGLRELVAGKGAARQFEGLVPGREVKLGTQPWTVVGVFSSGDAMESEIWGDAATLADAYRRGSSRNSITARLTSAKAIESLKSELAANPQLKIDVMTTVEFFAKQSERMAQVITVVGITIGTIMAIGATFGALNTMFAAVAARAREIATLRAIGFQGAPVVVAVMIETLLLALLGGLLGALIAWLLFNGKGASTMAAGSVGKLSFELLVSPALIWTGVKWSLAIGFIGGLFPAVRAARMPVTEALREA
ncbi:ABC transporter permease [Roseateles paludis]|jgi:putative ABC transport system permease protein|uniref:ABC transporter permease n=1 Tax=Roseateles paludis TaxID=3145238 RepID=A0ABV0G1R7_9BURK